MEILTIHDILDGLRDSWLFTRAARRNRTILLEEVRRLPGDLQQKLQEIISEKRAQRFRRPSVPAFGGDRSAINDETSRYFMRPISEDDKREILSRFREATSNRGIAHHICAVCGRRMLDVEARFQTTKWDNLPNRERLRPETENINHDLLDGCLVQSEGIFCRDEERHAWVCEECMEGLNDDSNLPPKYALANDLWLGRVPFEMRVLTIPERYLIARGYNRVSIVKLFPKDRRGSYDPNALQSGLKGNVTTFEMNLPKIAEMLEGRLLPHPIDILASMISVTYVGLGELKKDWLKNTFRVRRYCVARALSWLHEKNPKYYQDVEINDERLRGLPEDDIPDAIMALVHQDEDPDVADREREGYIEAEEANDDDDEDRMDVDDDSPDVIPLQYLGTHDTNLANLSASDLQSWGLANLWSEGNEGGYAVQHGRQPVSDIGGMSVQSSSNIWEQTYPAIFPYGCGGLDRARPRALSFTEHVRWCLQYHDRRFRVRTTFPFHVFSVEQKKQALASSKIQLRRENFDRDAAVLSTITVQALKDAEIEEKEGRPISNAAVRLLRKHMFAASARVMGSNASRRSLRSEIWGTGIMLNPSNLWLTISPDDLHSPIVQIFCGEEINMDMFSDLLGPSRDIRAVNVANDAWAASKYFNFIVNHILSILFGISVRPGGRVQSRPGIFGELSAYFGVVECQGRGTLHLHMLLWIRGAPSSKQMQELLQQADFRRQVEEYSDSFCSASIEGISCDQDVRDFPSEAEIAYSRQLDPSSESYEEDRNDFIARAARTKQVHTCSMATCLRRDKHGVLYCKRRAPWPISQETVVLETGEWHPQRLYGNVNNHVPALLETVASNNHIDLLLQGEETLRYSLYSTNYQTKDQGSSYNCSAVLAKKLVFHIEGSEHINSLRDRQRLLIFRAVNCLNRQQELCETIVNCYLMGWDHSFKTHLYVSIYWMSFIIYLHNEEEASERAESSDYVILEMTDTNAVAAKSQVNDYRLRGRDLEDFNVLSFFLDTYEGPKTTGQQTQRSMRSEYLEDHSKFESKCRILRCEGHNMLPKFTGKYFPRNDDPECAEEYAASALMLLKPWRSIRALKGHHRTWTECFTEFLEECSTRSQEVLDGIQHFHRCKTAADRASEENAEHSDRRQPTIDEESSDEDEPPTVRDHAASSTVTEDMVVAAEKGQENGRDFAYAHGALRIGQAVGLFPDNSTMVNSHCQNAIPLPAPNYLIQLSSWKLSMEAIISNQEPAVEDEEEPPGLYQREDNPEFTDSEGNVSRQPIEMAEEALLPVDRTSLLPDQRVVFDMVERHLTETLAEREPAQLLLQVHGEGGTGKSKVIQSITEMFRSHGAQDLLAKMAYTGIAASLIQGSTCHHAACIPIGQSQSVISGEKRKVLCARWGGKKYAIIDEISMISKQFLALLSRNISYGKSKEEDSNAPFGGINVIICGDFHQFPPVMCKKNEPLYHPVNHQVDTVQDKLGRAIYEQFQRVIVLTQQVRVEDERWLAFLRRLRHGLTEESDVEMLRSLVLTDENCPQTNFNDEPWIFARLVTPRHSVRYLWNAAAVDKHSRITGNQLLIAHARDTIGRRRRILTIEERYYVAMKKTRSSRDRRERAGLPNKLELAIGLKVMVTLNVETNLDIANGSRGEIVDVVLHAEHDISREEAIVHIDRQPAYILVKLDQSRSIQLPGLPEGVIPIEPVERKFQIKMPTGKTQTVWREQLPITPAYAFTDYRSQGQTLGHCVIDITQPPTGKKLTPFNVYVALSRSKGRENIRLLRDFEADVLFEPADDFLEMEDQRLWQLDKQTRIQWLKEQEN